jgi:exo-1,4-beta-D-glucosaminidase
MLPPDHWWPIDEYWLYHLARPQIGKVDLGNMTRAIEYSYGNASNLEDYSRKAQLLQYETNRAMFEAWGRNKYNATGILSWKGKSQWSSLQWQMYDVYLMPGGAYFGTKKGNEPLHVQYSYDDASIYVVNATLETFMDLEVDATVYGFDMKEAYHSSAKITVAPDDAKQAFAIPGISGLSGVYFLKLDLKDSAGKTITSNFYWLTTEQNAGMFTKLNELPAVKLEVSSQVEKSDSAYTVHIDLRNQSPHLAFAITPRIARGSAKELVLPIIWEDSYFSLLPGESRAVTASFDEKHLNGEEPWLVVEGWNIVRTAFELRN